jgi:hypothetical protein
MACLFGIGAKVNLVSLLQVDLGNKVCWRILYPMKLSGVKRIRKLISINCRSSVLVEVYPEGFAIVR